MAREWQAGLGKCPRCGKRWYAGLPAPEDKAERRRRLARQRAQGVHWTGGCIVTGRCRDCGVELVYEDDDAPGS